MTTPDPLKLARDAQSALPLPALWLAWNTSYTGIRFWTSDAAVAEAQAATGLALTGFYSAEQMRAAIDALPASVPSGEPASEPNESLVIGQAQQLIGALIAHRLLHKSMPEPDYINLWDVVKRHLRLVNKEGARTMSAAPAVAAPEPLTLTDAQIERHGMPASECPPDSEVMLVSSIRRLLGMAAAPTTQEPQHG